jgi:DNA-binding NarL/FixJ family response regulator
MPRLRPRPSAAPDLPPQVAIEIERTIAIVVQVRQELTRQTERLDQLTDELRAMLKGPEVPLTPLSDQQVAVLRALALGETNREIAARLNIAPGTVNTTLGRIYRKLNVRNRNEATFTAWRLGLI